MFSRDMVGYILEDGELTCFDCSMEFLEKNQFTPTEETGEVGGLTDRVKVRGWTSPYHEEVVWLPEMEA